MKFPTFTLASVVLMIASVASAQTAPSNDAASFPSALTNVAPSNGTYLAQYTQIGTSIDVATPLGGLTGVLGVEHAWGNFWVASRGATAAAGFHVIGQFTTAGALINTMIQPNTGVTTWGVRDLESDEANNKLWGGQEGNQLQEYNRTPGAPDTLAYSGTFYTITGAAVPRALCRDNTGTFYTKNFNTVTVRFTLNPLVFLSSLPANGKASYGLAYDRINDTIWSFDQNNLNIPTPPTAGDLVEINEMNKTTGALTGNGGWSVVHGVASNNLAGGLDIFEDNTINPGKLTFAALHQYVTDELNILDTGIFTLPQPTTYCTAKVNSQGCSPAIGYSGQSSATAASGFTLTATQELNNKVGLVLYSEFGRDASAFGPGGLLCVKAPTRRSKGFNSGGTAPPTADCSGVFAIDFNTFGRGLLGTPPNPAAYLSLPGQIVTAQFWGRDPGIAIPNNFSLSNGIEFEVGP